MRGLIAERLAQFLHAGEVVVEGGARHPRDAGDVLDMREQSVLVAEHLESGGDDLVAGARLALPPDLGPTLQVDPVPAHSAPIRWPSASLTALPGRGTMGDAGLFSACGSTLAPVRTPPIRQPGSGPKRISAPPDTGKPGSAGEIAPLSNSMLPACERAANMLVIFIRYCILS